MLMISTAQITTRAMKLTMPMMMKSRSRFETVWCEPEEGDLTAPLLVELLELLECSGLSCVSVTDRVFVSVLVADSVLLAVNEVVSWCVRVCVGWVVADGAGCDGDGDGDVGDGDDSDVEGTVTGVTEGSGCCGNDGATVCGCATTCGAVAAGAPGFGA